MMNKKRVITIVVLILILAAAAAISIKPVMRSVTQKQIEKTFAGADISIGRSKFALLSGIDLYDVKVVKDTVYDFEFKEISVRYSLFSLLRKVLLKVSVKNSAVSVTLPRNNIQLIKKHLNLGGEGKSAFLIESLELENIDLDIWSKDLNLKASFSTELFPDLQMVNSVDLDIFSLKTKDLVVDHVFLLAARGDDPGKFEVENIRFNKINVKDFKSIVRLKDDNVFLCTFFAEIFDGRVSGDTTLKIVPRLEYMAKVKFDDLNLKEMINDLELNKKFQMSGLLSGNLLLHGDGTNVEVLDGDFATAESGGTLTIHDTRVLENVARRSKQPLEILIESFKNYHYNTGMMKLSVDQDNLMLDMALDGETGKRDLNVTLHNFNLDGFPGSKMQIKKKP